MYAQGQGHPAQGASVLPVLGATTTAPASFRRELRGYRVQGGGYMGTRHHWRTAGLGTSTSLARALRVLWQLLSDDGPSLEGSLVLPH